MRNGYAKLAGILAILYAITFFGGIFFHYLISGSSYTLKYSLSLPKTWLVLVMALVIGFGLIKHYRWSWWLGLVAGIYQLIGISIAAQRLLSSQSTLPLLMGMFIVLFIAFLTLLLLPSVRRQFLTN